MLRMTQMVAGFAFLAILGATGRAWGDDSFLDRRIDKQFRLASENVSFVFTDQFQAIAPVVGKKVIAPPGLAEFAARKKLKMGSLSHTDLDKTTIRDYLNDCQTNLRLNWKYDAAQDAIVFGFSWWRDDPRTAAQLLDALLHAPVKHLSPMDPQLIHFLTNGHLDPSDTWRVAFDALLSKPENEPNAWKVRFAADEGSSDFLYYPVRNLLTTKVKDSLGIDHVLILNDEPPSMIPGEGYISYYVFDLNGRLEQGGVMSAGHRCEYASAWVDSIDTQIDLRVFFNGTKRFDQHLSLTARGLILTQATDEEGKPLPPYEYGGFHFGEILLHVPE